MEALAAQKGVLDVAYKPSQQRQKNLTPSAIRDHLLEEDPADMPKWWPRLAEQATALGPKQVIS